MKTFTKSLLVLALLWGMFSTVQAQEPLQEEFDACCQLWERVKNNDGLTPSWQFSNGYVWKSLAEKRDGSQLRKPKKLFPIAQATLRFKEFTQQDADNLLKLKHLEKLSLRAERIAENVSFPVAKLRLLKVLEMDVCPPREYADSPLFRYTLFMSSSDPAQNPALKKRILPLPFLREIAQSKTIRSLSVYFEDFNAVDFREIAKMRQLQSLNIAIKDEHQLEKLLPLKDSLHKLWIDGPSAPDSRAEEIAKILCEFRQLQVLKIGLIDGVDDQFLANIQTLPLKCLQIPYADISDKGIEILKQWDSLMQISIPKKGFSRISDEVYQSLPTKWEEKRVPKPRVQPKTKDEWLAQPIEITPRKIFFMDTVPIPSRLDAQGNYIPWYERNGGYYMFADQEFFMD